MRREQLGVLMVLASIVVVGHAAAQRPLPRAEVGWVPGHWTPNAQGFRDRFVPDPGFGAGVFAVPIDADSLLAFDLGSGIFTRCTRIDRRAFTDSLGGRRYYRVRCGPAWNGRDVLFVEPGALRPIWGERLLWQPAPRDSAAARSSLGAHPYAATARPRLLHGMALTMRATFIGRYPPEREFDELRGDSIAFGHYRVAGRSLRIGQSASLSSGVWFEAPDTLGVQDPLEWAFLPTDASQKTSARFTTLYTTPNGYLVMLVQTSDHEGAGLDQVVELYRYERSRWEHVVSTERTRMY